MAVLVAMGWCFRAQPSTNAQVVLEHSTTFVMASELFYLRHLRSCASTAAGKHHTASGATPSFGISCVRVLMNVVMTVLKLVLAPVIFVMRALRSMLLLLVQITLWRGPGVWREFQYLRKLVLQSTLSPLEIGACIVVVDASEPECQGVQTALAVFILGMCDWHVPLIVPHHYTVCRLLSASCMQAFALFSATLICWTFADPTFGKRAQISASSASRETQSGDGASEHVPTSTEDKISLDNVIAKLNAVDGFNKRAEEILAAAITLRDSSGRDRQRALRSMAATWGVAR